MIALDLAHQCLPHEAGEQRGSSQRDVAGGAHLVDEELEEVRRPHEVEVA